MLYRERYGLAVLPMSEEKKPLVPWKEFQYRLPTVSEMMSWKKENLGIITGRISNLVVVDCESREDAEWFWRNRGKSPVVVQTRRGFHFYFQYPQGKEVRNATKVECSGVPRYDVRAEGGYVLCPPSSHSEGEYVWKKNMIHPKELPEFKVEWRPEIPTGDFGSDKRIKDGVAYIARINAISGQGGHDDTYRAVACLYDAGMSEAEALLAILEWNKANADPPWSERELLHKVKDVFQ
jgi:hypothetical protein